MVNAICRIPSLLETEENVRREQCLVAVGDKAEFCVMDSGGLVTLTQGAAVQRSDIHTLILDSLLTTSHYCC